MSSSKPSSSLRLHAREGGMRGPFVLFLVCLSVLGSAAATQAGTDDSWITVERITPGLAERIFSAAKAEVKDVLVWVGAEWSAETKEVARQTLRDPRVAGRIRRDFLRVRFNFEQIATLSLSPTGDLDTRTHEFLLRLNNAGLPVFILFDGRGEELKRISGLVRPADFIWWLSYDFSAPVYLEKGRATALFFFDTTEPFACCSITPMRDFASLASVRALEERMAGQVRVHFVDTHLRGGWETARRFSVDVSPSVVFFDRDGKERKRLLGLLRQDRFEKALLEVVKGTR